MSLSPLPADPTAPTLQSAFALAARWHGGAELLVDDIDRLTGHGALDAVARVAAGMAVHGVGRGSVVAFLCGASVRHAVAFFACQWLGAIGCALHARDTPAKLSRTLGWLEADLLFADPALAGTARAIADACGRKVTVVVLADEALPDADLAWPDLMAPERAAPAPVAPDDDAAIILSSGTTGEPKGIVHTQRSLYANARVGPFLYGPLDAGDTTVVAMAPSFAAWIIVTLPHLVARVRVVFARSFDPAGFVDLIDREGVTLASLVPTMWRMVLATDPPPAKLARLRSVFYSGEPGSPDLVAAMAERLCPDVRTGYMSSEGCAASAIGAGPATLIAAGKAASTGRPISGADLRVVVPEGGVDDLCAPDETGEIVIRSASLAARYWKDPARTAEKFEGGWWRSGDLGRLDADGDLFVVGRSDNVINSGGIKVHAEEIESALTRHPAVAMAAVVGVPDPTWGQRIEAHLVMKDKAVAPEAVVEWCAEQGLLPRARLPKRAVAHDALPTGPTGKLYRRGLIE